ncbi:hypothetical protein C8A01DRAFT_33632 [Parachaetomium inaequale]|uniref:Endonuclease/exonuclease/phosphatase domain-containing protein n=1 Tax=Parachaetomium inaequale TaxID=2588326 RepID=A0AAN6PLV0_9PEZI|nr:hypothetical protein C8A01DRAFT_33632 [Parachaetomium inaequale]
MQRDALFADIALPDSHTLRLCTTHLESLRASPPLRPAQLAVAAQYLRQAHAGVLGGDLNAIEAFDRTLHAECGLRDAYLEMGGKEGEEAGMTWGQMVGRRQRERFGLGRLDKILFWGGGGEGQGEGGVVMKVVRFGRFGLDVVVEDEGAAARLVCGGELEKAWVTDHLGVRAEFRVEVLEKKLKEKETGREVVGEIRETGVEAGDGQEPVQAPSG